MLGHGPLLPHQQMVIRVSAVMPGRTRINMPQLHRQLVSRVLLANLLIPLIPTAMTAFLVHRALVVLLADPAMPVRLPQITILIRANCVHLDLGLLSEPAFVLPVTLELFREPLHPRAHFVLLDLCRLLAAHLVLHVELAIAQQLVVHHVLHAVLAHGA